MTIYTSLKHGAGRVEEIQRVAIENWRGLGSDVTLLDGPVAFQDVVARAEKGAIGGVLAWANADILFGAGLRDVLDWCEAQTEDFLVVGRRTDLLPGGQRELHRPSGMDYFIFRMGVFRDLPPTIMGRAYCDSALLAYCLRRHVRVIDATDVLEVTHQWHDYAHVSGGRSEVFAGSEAQANRRNNHLRDFGPHIADVNLKFAKGQDSLRVVRKHVPLLRRLGLWGLWNRLTRGGLGFWGIHAYFGNHGACYFTRSKVDWWSPNSNVQQRFRQVINAPKGIWTGFDFPCMWHGLRTSRRSGIPWTLFLWDPPSLTHRDRFPPLRWAIDFVFRWFARRCDHLVLNIHPGLLDEIGFSRKEIEAWKTSGKLELRLQDAFDNLIKTPQASKLPKPSFTYDFGVLSNWTVAKGGPLMAAALKQLPGKTCLWIGDPPPEGKISESITFAGRLPQAEAFELLRHCRVLVAPYLPVRSLKWNYVLKLFEYLQLGRPIIASDNPGNVTIAEKFPGRIALFKSGDVEDLVQVAMKTQENAK